jgi:uncharacterized protein YndB with AHSA1/START domain
MTNTGKYQVTQPSDCELTLTRSFDAPRRMVFDAFTKPEMVKRWLYGPAEWRLAVCEIDLRAGGKLRYVWRNKEKGDMGLSGVFREVVAPERLVNTELFDQDWTGGETVLTTVFEESNGRTTVSITVRYSSQAARDGALKTGMIGGWSQSHDRLDQLLAADARASQ